jgi:hypothetical protein
MDPSAEIYGFQWHFPDVCKLLFINDMESGEFYGEEPVC